MKNKKERQRIMEENDNFDFEQIPGKKLEICAKNCDEPLISIATPYYNNKEYIIQTAYSILNQTFPYWEWNIVNDGSTEEGTEEILKKVESLDKRIHVFNQKNEGRLKARDNAVKKAKCDLVFILDSDDCIDKTYLETAYWTLKTNPEASWAYTDLVTFEGKNFLWKREFDSQMEKKENLLSVCALIKKQAIFDVGGYSAVDKDVHEDWHLWLRMLEKGMYPVRMNYYGFWYRSKLEGSMMASIKDDKVKQKHAMQEIEKQAKKIKVNVAALQFPMSTNFYYNSYPYIFDWSRGSIVNNNKRNLLFIFPWFKVGGADKFNLDLISSLDQDKFNITIVTTEPCEYVWRQKFERFATVFDLTTFLHRRDWPAFIHYLMKTRNIDLVFESHSYFGYYVIPWLKSYFPEVPFVDYVHAENWSWRNGEYPRDSIAIAGLLDKTYTCTNYLRQEMFEQMGRTTENVEVVYIGTDTDKFDPDKVDISTNKQLLLATEKYKDKKKILFLCRLSLEKRPLLALRALKKTMEQGKDYVMFVVGDGPMFNDMEKEVKRLGLSNNVVFFGNQEDVTPFYKASDVLLICSISEGLTLTTYEAMSMKTPVISAKIGGQAELIDESTGILIENLQSQKEAGNTDYKDEEILRYSRGIIKVLENKEYDKMCENCRKKILDGFTVNDMINKLSSEIENFTSNKSNVIGNLEKQRELYAQYLVLYNELDQRNYYPIKGGPGVSEELYNARLQNFRDTMWKKAWWRAIVKFAKKTGLMKVAKKTKINKKILNK